MSRTNPSSKGSIRQRKQLLTLLIGGCFAALALMPAAAMASFSGSLTESASTLQAAGHPNLTLNTTVSGTEKIRDLNLDLGAGQHFNWEAPTSKCSSSSFGNDSCSSATQVGAVSANIKYGSTNFSVSGTIYQMTPGSNDVAKVGLVLRPPWYLFRPKIYLTGAVTSSTSTSALTFSILNIPSSSGGSITVNSLALTFQSRANSSNSGAYYALNPSKCAAATTTATLTSHNNTQATATASITPTGCESVPFTGSVSAAPDSTTAGASTGLNVTATFPTSDDTIQNSTVSSRQIDLAPDSGLNFPELGVLQENECSQSDLLQDLCGSTAPISDMGDVSSSIPFLPPTATGDVYATHVGNYLQFGIVLRGPRGEKVIVPNGYGTVLDLDENGSSETVRASISGIPQQTVSESTLDFVSPVFSNPDTCQSNPLTSTVNGHSGGSFTDTSYYTTTGC